jgi:hypothetical protein
MLYSQMNLETWQNKYIAQKENSLRQAQKKHKEASSDESPSAT